MPGFLSQYQDVTTVYFDDDNQWWAKVRKFPHRRDFKAAQAALISPEVRYLGEGENAQADTRGKIDTGAYQDELVARSLVEWNLTDTEGNPIPLGAINQATGIPDPTRYAAVGALPEPVFEAVLNAIEGAVRRRPADKEKAEDDAFRGDGRPGPARPKIAAPSGAK